MPQSKENFLKEVLSYIKFPFDREDIKAELNAHILDQIDDYIEQGHYWAEAEALAVTDMGDAREIGLELNKEHNPVLGWLWKVTNVLVFISILISVFLFVLPGVNPLFTNQRSSILRTNIVYEIKVDETIRIDDRVIKITHLIYEKNGNMNIFYQDYNLRNWVGGFHISWGTISDNLGNTYFAGGSSSHGGLISKHRITVDNFSAAAETLFIEYDNFNRYFLIEIPLPGGSENE